MNAKIQLNDDSLLIESFRNGDTNAINVLFMKHRLKMIRTISSFTRNKYETEEIYQEVCIKIYEHLKYNMNYDDRGKFIQWALRICKNYFLDNCRRAKKHEQNCPLDNVSPHCYSVDMHSEKENQHYKNEIMENLYKNIDKLPEEQRITVLYKIKYQWDFKTIAQKTNCGINTALARMRYAIKNLRKFSGEDDLDDSLVYA